MARTNAYVASREYFDFWCETIKVHCPTATFTRASFRKFLTAQISLLEQASQRSGPPVQELIRAETDGEHLSFRVLKTALDTINSTTDSELAAACSWDEIEVFPDNSPFGLPYVSNKHLTPSEWLSVYGEDDGVYNAFQSRCDTWASLSTCGFLKTASPSVPAPVVRAASSSEAEAEPVACGVWGPEAVPVPPSFFDDDDDDDDDDSDDSDAKSSFGLKPDRHGDVEEISRMRNREYMRTVGFIFWGGSGKAARKVQRRLHEAHMLKPTPAVVTVEELQEFLQSRFPNLIDRVEQVPFETSSSEDGHREGKWFRIILSDAFPCPDFQTSWHGSNLYVAGSIIKTGQMWPSYDASGRLFGIWSPDRLAPCVLAISRITKSITSIKNPGADEPNFQI